MRLRTDKMLTCRRTKWYLAWMTFNKQLPIQISHGCCSTTCRIELHKCILKPCIIWNVTQIKYLFNNKKTTKPPFLLAFTKKILMRSRCLKVKSFLLSALQTLCLSDLVSRRLTQYRLTQKWLRLPLFRTLSSLNWPDYNENSKNAIKGLKRFISISTCLIILTNFVNCFAWSNYLNHASIHHTHHHMLYQTAKLVPQTKAQIDRKLCVA